MARVLVQIVLPILLPALLYALWLAAEHRRVEAAGAGEARRWGDAPWLWLLALGLFFALIIAAALAVFSGQSIQGVYVPPHVEDGRIIPGHVEPR